MSNKLFIGGISFQMNEQELEEAFSQCGKVLSAKIIMDKFSGRSKGFGFVEMETPEEAQAAIEKLNGSEVKGRNINVSVARERTR